MFYELTTLAGPPLKARDADLAARDWIARAPAGAFLGSWTTELGPIGHVLLLRGFESAAAAAEERARAMRDPDPFGADGLQLTLTMENYVGLDFLPPARPRQAGGLYEFRTYFLRPGGVQPTLEGWRAAIAPAQDYTDHLVVNMLALDGRPRITHIWGFEDIAQRFELRRRHYAAGLWPPKGGPQQIEEGAAVIAFANQDSPLC